MKNKNSKGNNTGIWRWMGSDFFQKVALITTNRGLVMFLGFVISIILVRVLGPEGRGLYVTAMSTAQIGILLGNLGLQVPHTLLISRNKNTLGNLTANSVVTGIVIGGGGAAVVGAFFLLFPSIPPVHGWLLGLSLTWIPFGVLYFLLFNLLIGIDNVKGCVKIELSSKTLQILTVSLLAFLFTPRVEVFFAVALTLVVVSCIWQLFELRKDFQGRFSPSYNIFKKNLSLGLKFYFANILSFLLIRIDCLIVKYMLGAEQTGYYSVAASLADIIPMVPSMVGLILFPKLSSLTDKGERWKLARKSLWITGLFLLPCVFLAWFLAGPAIGMVYGIRFLPSVDAFRILIPGIYFMALQMVAVQFLKSEGYPWELVLSWGAAVLLNVLLNLWLVPCYGIVGASLSSTLCYVLIFFLTLFIIRNRVSADFSERFAS